MDREKKSREANRAAFSARALRGEAAAREVQDQALETLQIWSQARGSDRALDLATGGGYLCRRFAPLVGWSYGVDLVAEMVSAARAVAEEEALTNVAFLVAVVESLPFGDRSLDLVLTRRGPHHFADIPQALDEIHRVLKPGGRLLVEDLTVPEDPGLSDWINDFEKLCSPSHGRAMSPSEWRRLLEQRGFTLEHLETSTRAKDLAPLLARSSADLEDRLRTRLDSLDAEDAERLGYHAQGPHLATHSILLSARR